MCRNDQKHLLACLKLTKNNQFRGIVVRTDLFIFTNTRFSVSDIIIRKVTFENVDDEADYGR